MELKSDEEQHIVLFRMNLPKVFRDMHAPGYRPNDLHFIG